MLYALIAKDRPGTAEQRTAVRPVHLQHLESLGGKLKLGGALLDAGGTPEGSLIVVEAETLEEATAMFMADPFIKEGVFGDYEIRAWRLAFNTMSKEA